ncbi:MAG: hypothetical protein RM368_21770 [Nostoc sp. DedSLP03]|uniref:hypothetical protein n=1 Tax=Nostoc sp. DedSLP03 TaxID=3075400 RepID=UPI002AD3C0EA|nr:hypothetical protein [Nostoc sp. DedSLP03]MDZ7967548.1 hypothetical protein [Nostoc sp. DedSLP03]
MTWLLLNNERLTQVLPLANSTPSPAQGRVVRDPAKRSLPLITVVVKQNQIRLVDRKPAVDAR